ncbi:MAG: DUF4157 domain-containing protein [Kofleriaceae bacterium]
MSWDLATSRDRLDDTPTRTGRPAPGKVTLTSQVAPRAAGTTPPTPSAPRVVQADRGRVAGDDPFALHQVAAAGVSGSGGALPHGEAIARSFGNHDVSGIRAHVGGAAAQAAATLGTGAYATGRDVAFAGAPDLRQAAHEAAHVVQQRAGVQLDGGVGQAGDPYERHADDVAAAVVRGDSAEALLDAMAGGGGGGGGAAVQRDEMSRSERRTAEGEARGHALELEQLAHRIAYLDSVDQLTEDDRTGLTGMGFDLARVRVVHGVGDLEYWVFPRAAGRPGAGHAPVIAFRGTATMADVAEDATESGVGMGQFTMNQARITADVHGLGGGVIATGHSLGGALAQIAACYFPDQIASVVTFQAPGISSETLDRIRHRAAGHRPTAHHYRVDGCIVDDAGEEHLPGAVSIFGHGADPIHAHTTFPLLAEHGGTDGWIRTPNDPPPLGAAIDPRIGGDRRESSTDAPQAEQARTLAEEGVAEAGRTHPVLTAGVIGAGAGGEAAGPLGALAGGVVGAGGAALGGRELLADAGRRDRYVRLWIDEVVPVIQSVMSIPLDDFITRKCAARDLAAETATMLENYRGLFPELARADALYHRLGSAAAPSEAMFMDEVAASDPAAVERAGRYYDRLAHAGDDHAAAPTSRRSRRDIAADHAAGRAALAELEHPTPAAPPPRERRMPTHGPHAMVAPDRGVIADLPAAEVHAAAEAGVAGAGGPLPHGEAIGRSFGHHDVTGIRAHVGGAAAQAARAIGASAYATGDAVAFAGAPDLRQAAHEAAHVVQQRGGVRLDGGVGRAGDPFERHADAVAAKVVAGESAEALLDTMAHRGAGGGPAVQRLVAAGHPAYTAIMYRLGTGTPDELEQLREALNNELARGRREPMLPLSFTLGGEHFDVMLLREDGVALREAVDGMRRRDAATARRAARHEAGLAAPSLTPLGRRLADLIGVAGGEVGHGQEVEASVNVPLSAGLSAAVRLHLSVEHGEHGFHVSARLMGGLRMGTSAAHGDALAGLELEAEGTTAERAAELLGAALGAAVERLTLGVGRGAEGAITHHDDADVMTHVGEHESVDASVPLTVGGGFSAGEGMEGIEGEASIGTTLHTAAEGSRTGSSPLSFQTLDIDLETQVGPLGLHLEASIPFRSEALLPGERMPEATLGFEFSGHLELHTAQAALTAAAVDTGLRLVLAAIRHARGERSIDPDLAARVRARASLAISAISARLDSLAATTGDAEVALVLGLEFAGDETEVSVRLEREADPVPEAARGLADISWGTATTAWRHTIHGDG